MYLMLCWKIRGKGCACCISRQALVPFPVMETPSYLNFTWKLTLFPHRSPILAHGTHTVAACPSEATSLHRYQHIQEKSLYCYMIRYHLSSRAFLQRKGVNTPTYAFWRYSSRRNGISDYSLISERNSQLLFQWSYISILYLLYYSYI